MVTVGYRRTIMRKFIILLGGALLLTLTPLWADNVERFDGYAVHYNVFNAEMLDPRVAQAYKLRRDCGNGVFTVALRKDDGAAVAADIRATAITLVGQRTSIAMREVRDGTGIYYVGGFAITTDAEPLKFALTLRPEGSPREYSFDFSRQMFRC